MKLDRNINDNRRGKYALLRLRKLQEFTAPDDPFQKLAPSISEAIMILDHAGLIDWGIVGTEGEFFVTRLKDRNAAPSLRAYADSAEATDPEWAAEVRELAKRAEVSPWQKEPD